MDLGYLLQCSVCGNRERVPQAGVGERRRCPSCGAPLIPSHSLAIEVGDDTWDEEVLGSQVPSIVAVLSPHCGVCAQYEVSVRLMAGSLYGVARVLTLDAEAHRSTAERYGIKGVPTVLLFRGGHLLTTLHGPQGERGLRERLGV